MGSNQAQRLLLWLLASPEALAALRSEADGLRAVPVWDETNPREYADVQKEAKSSGAKVHFGRLMTIVSIKFYELAKHLQKLKGRIVYRGDCAKVPIPLLCRGSTIALRMAPYRGMPPQQLMR